MKQLLLLLLIVTLPVLAATPAASPAKSKILIIASNLQHMGDPEQHEARNKSLGGCPALSRLRFPGL